jgi:hypothetical protein
MQKNQIHIEPHTLEMNNETKLREAFEELRDHYMPNILQFSDEIYDQLPECYEEILKLHKFISTVLSEMKDE